MNLFYIQLLLSFFIGGSFIALLSFLAEKASPKMAGLIISFPSTAALSLFFISWAVGSEEIPRIAPATLVSIGSIMFYTTAYIYVARLSLPKLHSILASLLSALTVWLSSAFLLRLFNFSNLWIGVLISLTCCVFGYYFLTYRHAKEAPVKIIHYSAGQLLFRAVFCGSIITLAVYLSKTVDPYVGAILGGFPAAFTSTLLILHWHHDSNFLSRVFKNSPIGFLPPISFVVFAAYFFPSVGTLYGFLLSYLCSIGVFLIVSLLVKRAN